MHHAVTTEAVHEKQTFYVRRWSDDGVMIGSHLVESGPGTPGIYFSFSQTRHTHRGMRQDLFHEGWVEFSFEARGLFRIVPRQQNSLPFSPKVKACRHVNHHWKLLWQLIERFGGDQLASQRLDRQISAGHPGNLCGPWAGRVDDDTSRDETTSRRDSRYAALPLR